MTRHPSLLDLYELAEVEPGTPATMMLFPLGEWKSADYPKLTLTQELADEIIANFEADVLRTKVPVESVGRHDATSPAAGWFERLYMAPFRWGEVEGEALYGDWMPNERGAKLINDGEYAYNSVEVGPHKDPVSGETIANVLKAVALTNRPVLRMMPPVAEAGESIQLSELTAAEPEDIDPVAAILDDMGALATRLDEALKGKKGMPSVRTFLREIRSKVGTYKASEESISLSGPDPSATAEPVGDGAVATDGQSTAEKERTMSKLTELLKLSEGAGEDEVSAAVLKLAEERDAEKQRADGATAERDELAAKLAEGEKAERLRTIDVAIDAGEVLPAEKESFIKLAESAPEILVSTLEARKGLKLVDRSEKGQGTAPDEPIYIDASVELAEKAKARAAKDGSTYAAAEKLVLSEDADLRDRYAEFRRNPRKEA